VKSFGATRPRTDTILPDVSSRLRRLPISAGWTDRRKSIENGRSTMNSSEFSMCVNGRSRMPILVFLDAPGDRKSAKWGRRGAPLWRACEYSAPDLRAVYGRFLEYEIR
jgi:hypothetical protein